jgi:hypothetical protein
LTSICNNNSKELFLERKKDRRIEGQKNRWLDGKIELQIDRSTERIQKDKKETERNNEKIVFELNGLLFALIR